MNKKERENQERIKIIKDMIKEDIKFDKRKEELILSYIFNILTSKMVMNRYLLSSYGSIYDKKDSCNLSECINYISKKINLKGGDE